MFYEQIPSGPLEHKLSWTGVWRQLIAMNDRTAFAVREQAGHSLKSSVQVIWFFMYLLYILRYVGLR